MADIDNMRGDTLRVVEENTLDNMRGVTQRVISENSIDNTRGVTYRVYNVNGGSTPVIDELNVTPSTSAQVITAPSGTDGYSPVNVAAVTSAIDANITAGNIKKDVSILGVTGSYEGNVPTGTMYIISNGTYNVADKAIANVQVPTTVPEIYRVFRVNKGKIENSISTPFLPLPSTVTDIGDYCLARAYNNTPSAVLSGNIDLSSLTKISGQYACQSMFRDCKGITNVNLSSLTTIVSTNACQGMFYGCTGIISVNLSSLTSIYGANASYSAAQMFYGCTGLTSIDLSSLEEIKNGNGCDSMFYGCTHLSTVNLSKLQTITGMMACQTMFKNCTSLTSLSFPALTSSSFGTMWTNQFTNMLQGVTGCTLHFPSNTQAKIETLTGYPNFGGTNTTVLFDLPATE